VASITELALGQALSFEYEKSSGHDESKTYGMVPTKAFSKINGGKDAENGKGYNFLYGFKLSCGKVTVPYTVGRHLQTILEEGYAPADEDGAEERERVMAQVAVPGIGHEDVGAYEQDHGDEWNREMECHFILIPGKIREVREGLVSENGGIKRKGSICLPLFL